MDFAEARAKAYLRQRDEFIQRNSEVFKNLGIKDAREVVQTCYGKLVDEPLFLESDPSYSPHKSNALGDEVEQQVILFHKYQSYSDY